MKIALIGYGKMGQMIEQVVKEKNKTSNSGHEIILKINEHNAKNFTNADLAKADVAIEFTRPDAVVQNIYRCFDAGIPVIVGTTGWNEYAEEVKEKCMEKNGALLYASNFSIGVNILFEVNKLLARLMDIQPQYSITIEEVHHVQKLDAPSGTAISLAEDILKNVKRKDKWVNSASARHNELSIISVREGAVSGIHEVEYESDVDTILIRHSANSRRGFAEGALKAAEFLKDKKGVYSMRDVLGI